MTAAPVAAPVSPPVPRRLHLTRLPLVVALAGSGAWLMGQVQAIRGLEAQGAAAFVHLLTQSTTRGDAATATFYWGLFTPRVHGLAVTSECSAAFTAGPLLILVAIVALFGRVPAWRVVLASVVAVGTLVACNLLRLSLIAWSIHRFGPRAGLWWSHVVIGSALTIGSLALAIGLAVRIGFVARGSGRARP